MTFEILGLVGYGEVGKTLAAGLKPGVKGVVAWDIRFEGRAIPSSDAQRAMQDGISLAPTLAVLCQQSDLLMSAVTASNTLAVAQAVAPHIRAGAIFLDLNSASPSTKQQAAALIEAAGGFYVEAGVMTSVPPYGIRVPMLLGGDKAVKVAERLQALGMNAKAVSSEVGLVSAIKMCRSVMIKGLEALVIESYTTARHYGVEGYMIPTLTETFPSIDWEKQGAYFFNRVTQHGKRRAEEMREVANTIREAGFEPLMASAVAEKHDWVAKQARQGMFDDLGGAPVWEDYADRLLAARGKPD
jgi:3-hydroxyisobutyrate dehydrogenase-like beta-hydroxyacid dehydrogenase